MKGTISHKAREHLSLLEKDLVWLDAVVSSHERNTIHRCYYNLDVGGFGVIDTLGIKIRTLFNLRPEDFHKWFHRLESHMKGAVCFLLTRHHYNQDKGMYEQLMQVANQSHSMLKESTRVATSQVRSALQ